MSIPLLLNATEVKKYDLGNGVLLELLEVPFVKENHKISPCSYSKESVCLIDDQIAFGIAGNMPKKEFEYIKLNVDGKEYRLDSSGMFDAWGSRPLKYDDDTVYFVAVCHDADNCTARGLFSDAAGSFVAEWQIQSGAAQRTVLTYEDDIVNLFIQHIHPPVYD